MQTPISPEVPFSGAEALPNVAAQRAALAQSITPTGAPGLAAEAVGGAIAPGIMNIIAGTGALVITLLGLKTVVTGKPPWKQKNILS